MVIQFDCSLSASDVGCNQQMTDGVLRKRMTLTMLLLFSLLLICCRTSRNQAVSPVLHWEGQAQHFQKLYQNVVGLSAF